MPDDLMTQLGFAHQSAKAQYTKLSETWEHLGLAHESLADLGHLGEMVGPEDVIKASQKMIAGGVDAHTVAGWLAAMPQTGGQALQSWIVQHVQELGAGMAQLHPMLEMSRHQLGVSALQYIMGHHYVNGASPTVGAPSTQPAAESPSLGAGPGAGAALNPTSPTLGNA